MYLNHLSSFELLDVAEFSSFDNHLATLHIDNALWVKEIESTIINHTSTHSKH